MVLSVRPPGGTRPPLLLSPTGAYHASELQYIFDALETPVPSPGLTPAQEQLSKTMIRYWAEFARTGNPNSFEAPPWAPYGSSATKA